MPLAEAGWSSVHSVIDEGDFWDVVERLRDAGAEGILVLSIDQMIDGFQSIGGATR
jgi:ATP phosphoribosyltransferase